MKRITKTLLVLTCAGIFMGSTPSFAQTPNTGSSTMTDQDSRNSNNTDNGKYGLIGLVGLLGLLGLRKNNDAQRDATLRR